MRGRPALGDWNAAAAALMHYDDVAGRWYLDVELPAGSLSYKYVLLAADGAPTWEARANRTLVLAGPAQRLLLADYWHTPAVPENELFTAAFTKALFRRPTAGPPVAATSP
ncbi:carbohydrate-binding module family 20 domain-containing protein, partial [Hymenobacter coccineus]|uniref:carbohydrate-binding module family 20 domain-containing protein n=1 Tax=Hymenobacter coccineus TaxID=1908235 RepID=UPI001EFB1CD6